MNIVKQDLLHKKQFLKNLWSEVRKGGGFQLIQILGLMGMYFDTVVAEFETFLLLFRLALVILWNTGIYYNNVDIPYFRFWQINPYQIKLFILVNASVFFSLSTIGWFLTIALKLSKKMVNIMRNKSRNRILFKKTTPESICELRKKIHTRTRARTSARVRCACEKVF